MFDVALSIVQQFDLLWINIDSHHAHARARELERERQPDVTKTNDRDFHINGTPAKSELLFPGLPVPKERRIASHRDKQFLR